MGHGTQCVCGLGGTIGQSTSGGRILVVVAASFRHGSSVAVCFKPNSEPSGGGLQEMVGWYSRGILFYCSSTSSPWSGFPMVWEIVTVLLHMPRAFVTLVGQPVADILHEWWSWPFVELFQQYSKHPGLIRNCRGWLNPTDLPACLPERSSFQVRSKWFRLILQRFWRDAKFKISTACNRPRSTMPTCHLGCTAVPVPLAFLTSLDVWLRTHLSAPVNGQGKALNKVPLVFV